MFSMLLCALGTILCIVGIGNQSKWRVISGIIVLTLAAHEKLIASPFLWIGMVASVSALSWPHTKSTISTLTLRIITWSLTIPALSLLIIIVSFIYVHTTHGLSIPVFTAQQTLLAYSSSLWPLWNLLHIGSSFFNNTVPVSLFSEIIMIMKGFCIIVCIVLVCSTVLSTIFKIIISRKVYTAIPRINIIVSKLNFLLFSAITIAGIITSYVLTAKIWPLITVPDRYYIPAATFNNIALQFGVKTAIGHTLLSAAWACAVYMNALPTAHLFLMLFGAMITIRSQRRYAVKTTDLLMNLFTLLCICAPVVYGVLQLPLYSRYFNLFLLGSVLSLVPQSIKWHDTRPKRFILFYFTGFILIIIESYPFQPFVAAFRPVWSNSSSTINNQPSPGTVTPWYPGWGEELPDAFDRIVKTFPYDTQEIRLYHNFPAALIRPPKNVLTSAMPEGLGKLPYRYSDHDFYILSRNGVSTYSYIPFPYNTHPFFTITNRGFVKAWVFRGSDLYNDGFCF